jgi:hypothetical protein
MDPARFTRVDATTWRIEPHGAMRVPAIIYADEDLIRNMDDKVYEQATNVATLPGIVQACSFIARARPAPSGPATPACRRCCARSASRC